MIGIYNLMAIGIEYNNNIFFQLPYVIGTLRYTILLLYSVVGKILFLTHAILLLMKSKSVFMASVCIFYKLSSYPATLFTVSYGGKLGEHELKSYCSKYRNDNLYILLMMSS